MKSDQAQHINGKYLYYGFMSGSAQVSSNQTELNEINVFPVRDKDTGNNLASTLQAAIQNTHPTRSFKSTIQSIANAALIGARGNSGVIFAQFLYGLSKETKHEETITLTQFAESLKRSIPYIYKSISNPVEGTMLTVIKDWSDFLMSKKESIHKFKEVMIESYDILETSLHETTSKLKELSNHGVVDAGAKGFVLFIKGFINFMKHENIRAVKSYVYEKVQIDHIQVLSQQNLAFRYCTETILQDHTLSAEELKQKLEATGDSCVIAGDSKTSHIHVHTNHPADLFYDLKNYGVLSHQKVDDMQRQQDIAFNRKWNIALVTDSTCDLSPEILDHYQINMVPINVFFGDSHYLDKLSLLPSQFFDLLESDTNFPGTSQINEHTFRKIYSELSTYYDAIISIHLTGQFSGTFSSSLKAAKHVSQKTGKPILSIDSKNLSGALGLLVLKTAMAIESGDSITDIKSMLEKDIKNAKIYVSIRDLKSMIRGGRVPKPVGKIANRLGFNPVISMNGEGKSHLFGNTFSQDASLKKIFKHIRKQMQKREIWNYNILHAQNLELALQVEEQMVEIIGRKPVDVVEISPAIGIHAGNGAVAVSLIYKDN